MRIIDGQATDTTQLTATGTLEALNAALDGLRFVPEKDFVGNASICVDAAHPDRDADEPSLCLRTFNWVRESTGTQRLAVSIPIRVTSVNDAPTLSAVADLSVVLGAPIEPIQFTVDDVDDPDGPLTLNVTSSNAALVPSTSIVVIGTGKSRLITVVTQAKELGSTTITITASDGRASTATEFKLQVVPAAESGSRP